MDEAGRVLARLTRIEELRNGGGQGVWGHGVNGHGVDGHGVDGQGVDGQGVDGCGVDECGGGPAPELLAELRALVPEAEAWARAEGDARARTAATKLREEAEGMD